MVARHIGPAARFLHATQRRDLGRGVADHLQQLLVRPDIRLQRRDVQVADQDRPGSPNGLPKRLNLGCTQS